MTAKKLRCGRYQDALDDLVKIEVGLFWVHFLEAVRLLREKFPEVHIFGGLSNVSFGLPRRKLLNDAFIRLSVEAGCDSIMIDPIMNPLSELQVPPVNEDEYKLAAAVMTAEDEFGLKYLKYVRSQK